MRDAAATAESRFDGHDPMAALFGEERLLPTQLVRRPPAAEGTRRLMKAVLYDALECVRMYSGGKLGREAADWAYSDDWINPFSFLNICHALDLNPSTVRTAMLELWRDHYALRT